MGSTDGSTPNSHRCSAPWLSTGFFVASAKASWHLKGCRLTSRTAARTHDPRRVAVVHGHLAAGIDAAAEELALLVHGVERHVEGRLAVETPPLGVAHAGRGDPLAGVCHRVLDAQPALHALDHQINTGRDRCLWEPSSLGSHWNCGDTIPNPSRPCGQNEFSSQVETRADPIGSLPISVDVRERNGSVLRA